MSVTNVAKRNNTPLPRRDDIFDRIGEANVFS